MELGWKCSDWVDERNGIYKRSGVYGGYMVDVIYFEDGVVEIRRL